MPLDPIVKLIVDQVNALDVPSFDKMEPDEARAAYRQSRGAAKQEEADRVEDIIVRGAEGDLAARLYAPSSQEALPVAVYYHGGGFVIGDLDTHDALCRMIANRAQCAVVSVDYRLAPEHRFPAAAEDAYAALVDIHARAESLGLDPDRIAIAGDSAGGNLTAVVAIMARDRSGPTVSLQVMIYPVIDHSFDTNSYRDNAEGYFLTTDMMKWFWGHYLGASGDGANPLASPLRAQDLSGLPNALVITAEFDPLRDEGDAYVARLREAGVTVTHSPYDGMIHAFLQLSDVIPAGLTAIEEVSAALRTAFASAPVPAAGADR